MADNQILIFFPEPLLFLPFPGNVMINGIDPALPAFVLDKGKVVFHPDIAVLPFFQAVNNLAVAVAAFDIIIHPFIYIIPILRMNAHHSILFVKLPGLVQRHVGQSRKTVRQKFRYHASVRFIMHHRNTARQILHHRFEVFLQTLLLFSRPHLVRHISDIRESRSIPFR